MSTEKPNTPSSSPFHRGEHILQSRMGVRENMERFGRKVIRDYMPEQHRTFYQQLAYILVGHVDDKGWPWASILCNPPGFMSSSDERSLNIEAKPALGDPLEKTFHQTERKNQRLGLLGIELETRRRNRLSGTLKQASGDSVNIAVDQAFGNCPQYIQSRGFEFVERDQAPSTHTLNTLDADAIALIKNSDTFFVSSYVGSPTRQNHQDPEEIVHGVDISHRGGQPGFVQVNSDKKLTIPDYTGNFHFNTLGNFLENPKAGLLFIDFDQGHLLMLTGRVEIIWDSEDTQHFEGAERFWTFELEQALWSKHSLPLKWTPAIPSPNSSLTGNWTEAENRRHLEGQRKAWQGYEVVKIQDESDSIRSFYFKPSDGAKHPFLAGQFLTIRATIDGKTQIRTYTVSSAPYEDHYRISVKRDGVFSQYLHQNLSTGDHIEAQAPAGDFVFNAEENRPALMIAAGVGITPMVSMLRHALAEAVRLRHLRPICLMVVARNQQEQAFYQELEQIAQNANGLIEVYWCLTQADPDSTLAQHYHLEGRLQDEHFVKVLPTTPSDVLLCGPAGFMQDSYNTLRRLGVPDKDIHAESFGPASMQRDTDTIDHSANIAESAVITVLDQDQQVLTEQSWQKEDGNLLNFFQNHGMEPAYGCRNGQCGSCTAKLVKGKVDYEGHDTIAHETDRVLLCCAKPAKTPDDETPSLTVELINNL